MDLTRYISSGQLATELAEHLPDAARTKTPPVSSDALAAKLGAFPEQARDECLAFHALCSEGRMARLGVLADPVVGYTLRDDWGDAVDHRLETDVERHHASTAILLGYDGGGGYFYLLETGAVAIFYDEWQWATMSSLGAFLWADLHCQRLSNAGTSEKLDGLSDSDVRAASNFGMPEEYLPSVSEDESEEPPAWLRG